LLETLFDSDYVEIDDNLDVEHVRDNGKDKRPEIPIHSNPGFLLERVTFFKIPSDL
jgi:hypothetical protein